MFVPHRTRMLFFISVPLFLVHVVEEYVTLYYPTLFAVAYRTNHLSQAVFLNTEALVILALLTMTYLLYKQILPNVFLILPGLMYLYQFEHITAVFKIHTYYPGLFTGILLFVLGIWFWGTLIRGMIRGNRS